MFEPTDCGPAFMPTGAAPGSPEKFAVLCERVERGQPLWHPHDEKRLPGEGPRPQLFDNVTKTFRPREPA